MKNTLFLISTPSQAFFLAQSLEIAKKAILIITIKSSVEADRILSLLGKFEWKEIQIWKVPHADDKLVYFKLFQVRLKVGALKSKYSEFSEIYFGSYANLVHLGVLSEYENKSKLHLLYDGLQLVSVNHFRNKSSIENRKTFPIAYRILGFKEPKISELTYCSPLPMKVKGKDQIEVIQRRESFQSVQVDEDVVFFIGQPLADLGMVSSEFYIETIRNLDKILSKKLIYFPHPRENITLIEKLSMDFEIKKPNTIFEEYYLQLERVPGTVISFYSSVLANLIYLKAPSKIIAIEIPPREIKGNRFLKLISPIYEYFHKTSNSNFSILDGSSLKI